MSGLLTAIALIVALPGVVAAVHLTVLSMAALVYRPPAHADGPPLRLLVVIAARNEEAVIGSAVAALTAQRREGDVILVVADRCTDRTAALARAAGAEVLERPAGAPAGKAAAINDGLLWARCRPWDALVTVDADTIAADGFLVECEGILHAGADVAQSKGGISRRPRRHLAAERRGSFDARRVASTGPGTPRRGRPTEGAGHDRAAEGH